MSKLLSFEKGSSGVFERAETLDAMWAEAEALGKVSLESRLTDGYRATVNFRTVSGSHIFAEGRGREAKDALRGAIAEALALGAGNSS